MKIAIALFLIKTISLSFNYKENSPSSLFPYHNAASDDLPLGHLSNPAYLPLWNLAYVSIDYGKPYWMEEINSGNLRLGYGFNNIGLQLGWNRFGIDEYKEDVVTGNVGYMPCRFFSAGIGISYNYININTEDLSLKHGLTDFSLSVLLLPFDWLNIAYMHENIYSTQHKEREDILYPDWSFGITIKPVRGINFVWNINRLYYDYLHSFFISANLISWLCLKAGYSKETSSYAASITFLYRQFSVSYGLNYHSYLGLTHKVGLTISGRSLTFEQVNYNKKLYRQSLPEVRRKININKCSLDELIEIDLFSKEIAESIIKYRNIIGPISSKGLFQIGLTEKNIEHIRNHITGLASEAPDLSALEKGKTKKRKKVYTHKKTDKWTYTTIDNRKSLFQRLLKEGFSASTALKIAELSKHKSRKDVIREIRKLDNITHKRKILIIKICNDIL